MRKGLQGTIVVAAATLAAFTGVASAEDRTTVFLIDGSGSMWGRFEQDKKAKIDTVRDLLMPIISGSAAGQKIGLVSYGHRRTGDCSDVEVIAAPSTARDGVLNPLQKLNPRGKGPLVEGLKQSVAAIGANRPASIVVIGDGIDNCRQDTCAAAAEFAKSSPGVAVHIISIGVDPAEHPRLTCVTKETGGKFHDVKDPLALAAAISEAAGTAGIPTAAAAGAPSGAATATRQAAASVGVDVPEGASLVAVAALEEGKAALSVPMRWRILKSDGTPALSESSADKVTATLDPGTYTVEVDAGRVSAKKQVTIEAGRGVAAVLPLDAGRLFLKLNSKTGEAAGAARATITKDGGKDIVWLGKLDGADLLLPPGSYAVTAADGLVHQTRDVTLTVGTETTADFDSAGGRLELNASLTEGGAPLSGVTFTIAEDDPESPDGRRELTRSLAPKADFRLTPGTYYVSARAGAAETQQRIAVSAGDTLTKTLVMAAAELKATALIANNAPRAGQAIVYRVMNLETKREVVRTAAPELDTVLAAGKYRISAALEGNSVAAVQDITLEAGKAQSIVLNFSGGEIGFKPPAHATAIPGEVFWEIKDQSGKAIWHASTVEPKVFLAPGRYTVRLEARDKSTEAAFEVRPGDQRQIELGAN